MAQEEEPRKIKYPDDQSSYEILDEIGKGLSSIVYKAVCRPMNSSIVAIKAINLDKCRVDMRNIIQETRLSHPNILQTHSYFLIGRLWVVMPFMSAGSLESIISHSFPNGLSESCIARVLKEILKALVYLHDQGHLHRNIKASNILIDSDGSVKLADFGVSSSIYEPNSSQAPSSLPFSSSLIPFWMAPEEIHSHTGYSFESDIWSFGITALELAHGGPPLFHFPLLKSLINWITHRFRSFEYEKNRKDKKNFSGSFKDMVKSCLIADPSKRPSAKKLLTHPFFWNCKNADFLVKNMLQELPTIEERFTITKQIAPPPTSRDEKGSPTVKHNRRISGWNFNEMDLVFEPVFTTEKEESSSKTQEEESITKRVRFGKEVITYESSDKDDENPSRPIPAEYTEVSREAEQSPISQRSNEESKMEETGSQIKIDEPKFGGHDDAGLQISATLQVALGMIPNLEVLLRSLSSQQELVSNMLFKIGGEVEKQLLLKIQQLRLELDQERNKCSALEMQLESIRRSNAADVSHSNSDATGCNGHGSSSK